MADLDSLFEFLNNKDGFRDKLKGWVSRNHNTYFDNLYVCITLFRFLSPPAKHYVLHLLYIDAKTDPEYVKKWIFPSDLQSHDTLVRNLLEVKVLQKTYEGEVVRNKLNQKFQNQMRKAIGKGFKPPNDFMSSRLNLPTAEDLEKYTWNKWQDLLQVLVNPDTSTKETLVFKIFSETKLLSSAGSSLDITASGLNFLLMDMECQMWFVLREYIYKTQEAKRVDLVSFLIELGFYIVGKPYSILDLPMSRKEVVKTLSSFGLVKFQINENYFIPTELSSILASGMSLPLNNLQYQGYIVVEINSKVYAYTPSPVQKFILNLFIRIEYEVPNMIVGTLTREKMYEVFDLGINSKQVVQFFSKHSNKMTDKVPYSVATQIKLWEADKQRVKFDDAYLYDDFPTEDLYTNTLKHSMKIGAFLWKHQGRKQVIVDSEKDGEMRKYMKDYVNLCNA